MVAGRPRESIPEKKELIKLGEDLLAWATEKKKGELRCRWCQWYAIKHFLIRAQWKRMLDTPEFRPYYEAAQAHLAQRYVDGSVNQSIAHRYLRIYDPELKDEENKDADDNELRKAAALKGQARAEEEERQKVIDQIQRNKRKPK